jgi:hypothetical protein
MVSVNVNVVFDSCMNIYEERELDNCKERKNKHKTVKIKQRNIFWWQIKVFVEQFEL